MIGVWCIYGDRTGLPIVTGVTLGSFLAGITGYACVVLWFVVGWLGRNVMYG